MTDALPTRKWRATRCSPSWRICVSLLELTASCHAQHFANLGRPSQTRKQQVSRYHNAHLRPLLCSPAPAPVNEAEVQCIVTPAAVGSLVVSGPSSSGFSFILLLLLTA